MASSPSIIPCACTIRITRTMIASARQRMSWARGEKSHHAHHRWIRAVFASSGAFLREVPGEVAFVCFAAFSNISRIPLVPLQWKASPHPKKRRVLGRIGNILTLTSAQCSSECTSSPASSSVHQEADSNRPPKAPLRHRTAHANQKWCPSGNENERSTQPPVSLPDLSYRSLAGSFPAERIVSQKDRPRMQVSVL